MTNVKQYNKKKWCTNKLVTKDNIWITGVLTLDMQIRIVVGFRIFPFAYLSVDVVFVTGSPKKSY